MAVSLTIFGVVVLLFLFVWVVLQDWSASRRMQWTRSKPIVPVNLVDHDNAVIVTEGRGRVVYVNEHARHWFNLNGDEPNLTALANRVQPADNFRDVFIAEGRTAFRIGERHVEAASHYIPSDADRRMVVVLREVAQVKEDMDAAEAIHLMTDVSHIMGREQNTEKMLTAILQRLNQVMPFDYGEINVWESDRQVLRVLGRMGVADYSPATRKGEYTIDGGFSGWLIRYRQALLVTDAESDHHRQIKYDNYPYCSFIGVPLQVGERFIGTLEIASHEKNGFDYQDLNLLQSLSGQVAVMIENARLYREQSNRLVELSGLQQLAQGALYIDNPPAMYRQLTTSIALLMSVDIAAVLLLQEESRTLVAQSPVMGVADTALAFLRVPVKEGSFGYTLWQSQDWWFTNQAFGDATLDSLHLNKFVEMHHIRALGFVPLSIGRRRFGAILIANPVNNQELSKETMRLLNVFGSEVAILVDNHRLFNQDLRRSEELNGLQQLADVVGNLQDVEQIYEEVTARIADLMNVEMCGILLLNEEQQTLELNPPMYGGGDSVPEDYHIPLDDGEVIQNLWSGETRVWFSNHLQRDLPRGSQVARLAKPLDGRKIMLVALQVGGRRFGMLQLLNKRDDTNFDDEDAEVLTIFASQIEVLIENARLYLESRQRYLESDNLRKIAEQLASTVNLGEVIHLVLEEASVLMKCEAMGVGLLDTTEGKLVYSPEFVYGRSLEKAITMDIFSEGFVESPALSRRPFWTNDTADDTRILPQYMEVARQLNVTSSMTVPLVIQDRTMGELTAFNKREGQFAENDLSVVWAVAAQIAAAIERTRLYQSTDEDLRARVQELDAIDRIGQELAESLDLSHIMEVTRSEVARTTGVNNVTVVVLARRSEWLESNTPLIEKRLGGDREFEGGLAEIEKKAIQVTLPVTVPDYHGSDITPLPPGTRSAIVQPMSTDGQVIGLLHVFSRNPNVFTDKQESFLARVAKQTGLAVMNAIRYREQLRLNEVLSGRANQLSKVYTLGQMIRQGEKLEAVLTELSGSLAESVGFRKVMIQVVDDTQTNMELLANHGVSAREYHQFQQLTYTVEQAKSLLKSRWQMGKNTFFLASEYQGDWFKPEDDPATPLIKVADERAWRTTDLFVAPMFDPDHNFLGWISVEDPLDERRPTLAVAESLEIFAAEAAFSIENYRLLQRIRDEANVTRAERDRLALLHLVASEIQRTADMQTRLQTVVDGIQAAGWEKVRLTMRDENLENTLVVYAGYSEDEKIRMNASIRSGQVWRARLADPLFQSMRVGSAYYARYDHPWTKENSFRGQNPAPPMVEEDRWHPQDQLYLPLYGQNQNRIIGIITMEQPRDKSRPTETSLQPIELFATQAAAAIENTQLYIETLRQKETEQRLTEMMESVTASLDVEHVLRTMADGLSQMIAFTRMHIALPMRNATSFNLRRVEVFADGNTYISDDEPINAENTALQVAFRERKILNYPLRTRVDAQGLPDLQLWYDQGERVTMMVPMIAGGEIMGVLRLGSIVPDAYGFSGEHNTLVERMANLSAVSINHSRVLNNLLTSTAYNEAVVEAIQQAIVVLDRNHIITSINSYIRQKYNWTDEAIGKVLYDYEPEFGVFLKHSITLALTDGSPQHQFEVQDFDAAGNRMIRNFYSYPLREANQVTGVVLLIEDVTERAMLESDLAQRAEQLAALTSVSSRITSTLATDDVVKVVLEALESVMDFDGVTLWLRESDRLKVMAAYGFNDPDTARPEDLIGLYVDIETSALFRDMAERQQILNVGDTAAGDPRFPGGELRVYKNWLGAPLISQDEVIGVIALEKREPHYYDSNHEQLLQAFANQASIALRNAQLFEQTTYRASELDRQTRRLELLNRVAVALSQSLDIENIFEITLRETAIALDIQEAIALKVDHEHDLGRVVVEYPRGDEEPDLVYSLEGHPVIHRLRETLLPLVVDNSTQNVLSESVQGWLRLEGVQSILFVPLVVGGTIIGLMRFDSLEPNRSFFSAERLEIAQTLASQAAIAVQNASLFEQSVMRTHELETLFEASQATAVTLDLDEAMRRVVNQMMTALRADYCSIALWDEVENHLEIRESVTAWGDANNHEPAGTIYDLSTYSMREQALRQREVLKIRQDQPDLDDNEAQIMLRNGARDRLLVPLVVNDYSIGLIDLEIRDQHRFFDSSDIRLARTLAAQSAIAIENARLQTETRAQIEELYIINDLSTAVSSKVNLDELFPMVRDQLPLLTDSDILYVALFDEETLQITFPIAVDREGEPVEMNPQSLGADEFSYVINLKAPLLLWGARMPEARKSYGIETQLPTAKCFLGVPMMAGDDVLGVLAVQDDENPRAFGLNDQRILTTVASQLGVAVQNARLFTKTARFAEVLEKTVKERTSELEQERQRMQILYDITTEVSASLDITRVLEGALEKVANAIHATSAVIMGIDEVSEQLYVMHSYGGLPVSHEKERTQLRLDQGLAGWVIQNRTGVVINDVQNDDRWAVTGNRDLEQRSAVAALLEVGEDSRGVMMLFSDKLEAFNEEHLKLVSAASSQLANSMSNAELYSLIRDQAERLGAILREEQREAAKNTAILDSVTDGIMYTDEHGNITLFNTSAERILEVPAARMLGRSIKELSGLYGSGGLWTASIQRWMNDPTTYNKSSEDYVEESLEMEGGRVINVRLSPVVMGDQLLGTVSVFRDITRLVEVDRLKTEFVATVSHELRTPMTSIKGYADLLLLGAAGEVTEGQQRFLETIKQNADRLSILVDDLLEVSRIDQGRAPLHLDQVPVPELLQSIADHLIGLIEESGRPLKVEFELPDNLPPLRADYDKIIQIMQNLADNAYNYTIGTGTITLGAKHEEDAQTVVLFIKDMGVGIPPHVGDRVFERFFRGDEYQDVTLDTPGTGLGLSIVKSLVEMHGGSIWYESEMGLGTTFFVRIPAMEEELTTSE